MREQATAINEHGVALGWHVVPAETRFSRVSTGFKYMGSPHPARAAGFKDTATGDYLLLVFFDRPCRLTGIVIIPPTPGDVTTNVFDVNIDKAGFHWLATHKDQAKDTATVEHAASSVRPVLWVQY